MSSKTKAAGTKASGKPGLVPKLRFPEFRGAAEWALESGDTVFDQINNRNPEPGLPVLAITQEHGAIPRHMIDYHVSVTEKSIESYKVVRVGDFIISLRSFQGGIEYSRYHGICSPAYVILRRRGTGSDEYFRHYLKTDRFIRILTKNLEGLRDGKMISYAQFSELLLPTPGPAEQQEIADCLSSIDEVISAQARKVDALRTHKKGLMQELFPREGETQPRLRFPEFQDDGEWEESTVGAVVQTVTPPRKLQTSDYKMEGQFPIVDQSQDHICGWTDDADVVVGSGLPVIIFGDHTCALKFIDHPFAQGADGIKILRPRRSIEPRFLFSALEANPVVQEGYKRHFSVLTEKRVLFPDPKSGEQQRIASCLISLDTLIAAETQKLETLKRHKCGLMQQLFPSVEEDEA